MAYSKTDFTQDQGTVYKTKIDDNFAALEDVANTGDNWTATAEPTVNDDQTQGYRAGSRWYYAAGSPHVQWVCVDAGEGAADWVPVSTVPVEQWVRLEQKEADNDSQIDFVLDINNYDQFKIIVRGLMFSEGTLLEGRFSDNSGSSFISSGYRFNRFDSLNNDILNLNADSNFMNYAVVNSGAKYFGVVYVVHSGSNDDNPLVYAETRGFLQKFKCEASLNDEKQIDAIRLSPQDGTVTEGTLILYGWKDGS